MKRYLFFLTLFLFNNIAISQTYNVANHQKINELNGGFNGVLDIEDNLGVSIDNIGDLDGNGFNDLAVGAFSDDDGGYNRGAVWILFLDGNDNVISHTKISDISGNFNGILDDDDRFGGAVSYLGDINNDGYIELAVGADYDGDGGYWHGAVWILSLNSDGTVYSFSKISDFEGNFTGFLDDYSIFGTDIENIGDLNGDGITDIVVTSRRLGGFTISRGAVWILFMNADLTVNSHQRIGHYEGGFGALDIADYFGGSVANIGDLNDDGVVDIVVGCYRDDDQLENSGSFYVLFLNTDGTVNSYQKVSNQSGNLNTTISQEALFGESIDGVLDIDADGKIEIVVGAMKQVNPTLSIPTGAFFIIELNADGTVSEEYLYTYAENCFSGQLANGDLFGGSVCVLNDVSGNIKIATGAYRDSENGYRKGAAWILNLGELSFNVESYMDPTGCGTDDGSITLSNLSSNTSYTVGYDYEGESQSIIDTSNSWGFLVLTSLGSGNYENIIVEETLTGCNDSLGDVVLISQSLIVSLSCTDAVIDCSSPNGNVQLNATSDAEGAIYTWVTTDGNIVSGDDTSMPIVNEAGTYTVTVTDSISGCSNTCQAMVTIDFELPTVSIEPVDDLCLDYDSVQLIGLPSGGIFSGDNVTSEGEFTSSSTGTYTVVYTYLNDENGCENSEMMIISVLPLPTCNVNDAVIDCSSPDGSVQLTTISDAEEAIYTWVTTDGNIVSGVDTSMPIVNQAGTYTVTVTDSISGCSNTCQAMVIIDFELPTVTIEPIDDLCLGHEPVQLIGLPFGGTFSGDNVSSEGEFTSSSIGTYTVVYIYLGDEEGCESEETITISVIDCCEVDCCDDETAFAYNNEFSTCFSESDNNNRNRWGWSNGALNFNTDYSFQLVAGAGRCVVDNGELVGDVSISYNAEGDMVLNYSVFELESPMFYQLGTVHAYIGCVQFPERLAPGQMPYQASLNGSSSIDIVISADDMAAFECSQFYFIAHAEVSICNNSLSIDEPIDTNNSQTIFMAYPVPFKNSFTVRYKFYYTTTVRLEIIDLQGRLVITKNNLNYISGSEVDTIIEVPNDEEQMLFLRVTTTQETIVKKLILHN